MKKTLIIALRNEEMVNDLIEMIKTRDETIEIKKKGNELVIYGGIYVYYHMFLNDKYEEKVIELEFDNHDTGIIISLKEIQNLFS